MVKATLLARAADGLPLAEGLDTEKEAGLDVYKQQAKQLCRQLATQGPAIGSAYGQGPPSSSSASRMSVESGPYVFHSLIECGVVYMTICNKAYPKKLAFGFLEELQKEFNRQFGDQIETAARPYAFVKFDTFIQRMKKQYADARAQRNLDRLQAELSEVHSIMTRNISDVLGQGERLERVSAMSSNLAMESKRYAKKAQALSRQALMKKYVPIAVVGGIVFFTLLFRWYFY
ncbi:vesicle transport protein SEC22 [Pycnococcus provasolii]